MYNPLVYSEPTTYIRRHRCRKSSQLGDRSDAPECPETVSWLVSWEFIVVGGIRGRACLPCNSLARAIIRQITLARSSLSHWSLITVQRRHRIPSRRVGATHGPDRVSTDAKWIPFRVVESGADGSDEINNSPTTTTTTATAGRLVAAQTLLGLADRPGVIAPPRRNWSRRWRRSKAVARGRHDRACGQCATDDQCPLRDRVSRLLIRFTDRHTASINCLR